MATNVGRKPNSRPPTASMAYPTAPVSLQVPRTPLESRQGYHPKTDDRLLWKSPPSRQLSRQKRVEYESDVRERFYDDYLGNRTTGDARNEVMTTAELAKLKFDPSHYRANAYQGLAHDPMRRVPVGLDFNNLLEQEKMRERYQQGSRLQKQRRPSDPNVGQGSSYSGYYQEQYLPQEPRYHPGSGPPVLPPIETASPRTALPCMDETVNPEMVPAMENWLQTASKKDQQVAANFFRTMSSQGRRPDPAAKASVHRSRVRSAVITPTRKMRQEQQAARSTFQQLSKETAMEQQSRPSRKSEPSQKYRMQRSNSLSEKGTSKGSMFTANKQLPSHFTIHPDWASEGVSHSPKKRK